MGSDGEMMQWVTNQNGLDQLRMENAPVPSQLKANEVLVKINSVSLNYRDTEGKIVFLHLSIRHCALTNGDGQYAWGCMDITNRYNKTHHWCHAPMRLAWWSRQEVPKPTGFWQ